MFRIDKAGLNYGIYHCPIISKTWKAQSQNRKKIRDFFFIVISLDLDFVDATLIEPYQEIFTF